MVRRASFGWFDGEGSRRSLGVTIGGAVVIGVAEDGRRFSEGFRYGNRRLDLRLC